MPSFVIPSVVTRTPPPGGFCKTYLSKSGLSVFGFYLAGSLGGQIPDLTDKSSSENEKQKGRVNNGDSNHGDIRCSDNNVATTAFLLSFRLEPSPFVIFNF